MIFEDNFASDYFPEPPTPIYMIFPLGYRKTLEILNI